jgi:hypothetical protein
MKIVRGLQNVGKLNKVLDLPTFSLSRSAKNTAFDYINFKSSI